MSCDAFPTEYSLQSDACPQGPGLFGMANWDSHFVTAACITTPGHYLNDVAVSSAKVARLESYVIQRRFALIPYDMQLYAFFPGHDHQWLFSGASDACTCILSTAAGEVVTVPPVWTSAPPLGALDTVDGA